MTASPHKMLLQRDSREICGICGQEEDLPISVARRVGWKINRGGCFCPRCWAVHVPRVPVWGSPKNGTSPQASLNPYARRNQEIADMYFTGDFTLEALGTLHGLTRERVRQIVTRAGVSPSKVRKQREAERAHQELEARREAAPPCKVCKGPVLGTPGRTLVKKITCSHECAEAWGTLRFVLDPEEYARHRLQVAESLLRRFDREPEKCSPSLVAYSLRVVAGTAPPPNRHWIRAGSKTAIYAAKFGIDLGQFTAPKPSASFPCAATNLDGSPCSRRCPDEGAVCHIHARRVANASNPS